MNTRNRRKTPILERLGNMTNIDDNGCIVWSGYIAPNGYATINLGRKNEGKDYIHRVVYELKNGKIPEGLHIDHLCRNRACINLEHLELVTPRENIRRGIRATKTECVNGHNYLADNNLYRDTRGNRQCRKCRRIAIERFRQKV